MSEPIISFKSIFNQTMNVIAVQSPQWGLNNEWIFLTLLCDDGTSMIFSATDRDQMPYGRELYERTVSGEFGDIAEYSPLYDPQGIAEKNQTAIANFLENHKEMYPQE